MTDEKTNIKILLETIIEKIPCPKAIIDSPLTMLISQTESNNFFRKMLIRRIN